MSQSTASKHAGPILPGATIGVLGGGQLGRMFAIAARRMGYRVHTLDPTQDCPAGQVADVEVNAAYDDVDAAMSFASRVDLVTFEFENVPAKTLSAIESVRPVRPSPFVLETTRHRLREKDFLAGHQFPVAPYRRVDSIESLEAGLRDFGDGVLKTAEFGYDGKGQWKLAAGNVPDGAKTQAKSVACVLEKLIPFDREISVIVARSPAGEIRVYDVFENVHTNHILDTTVAVARSDESNPLHRRAKELASKIAATIGLVGVLCVEMFAVGDEILVNELAPRPHNSGHLTFDYAATSQFEQQLRAVCGLSLGDTNLLAPVAAMVNLLGDVWFDSTGNRREPNWPAALATHASVKLHLYGKTDPKRGRKMGHLTATGDSAEPALERVRAARAALYPA